MTDYKAIFGKKIKFLTSDLDNAEGEGEIFYSDTDSEFKVGVSSGAWHSGASMTTARYGNSGSGTQTAALSSGGNVGPSDTRTTATEEYNGTGF